MADTNEQNDLPTIADDLVVTKYKMAAEIVNSKLSVIDICVSVIWYLRSLVERFCTVYLI